MEKTKKNTTATKAKYIPTNIAMASMDRLSYEPVLSTEVLKGDYVQWGEDDTYPYYLWYIYNNCATLQTIINRSSDFTIGNGIINNTYLHEVNDDDDSIEDVVKKIILDRWIFGGFTFQLKFNKLGIIIGIKYIDIRECRVDENEDYVFVLKRDGKGKVEKKKYNAYNPKTCAKDGVQIYYYKGIKTRSIYPICDYNASLVSAATQIEIQTFHYEELLNNFSGSMIVNFNNGVPTEKAQQEYVNKFEQKKTGSRNAGNVIFSFNDSKDNATTFDRISPDNLDTRYKDVEASSRENLFISLGAMPQLFGLNYNSGFSEIEYNYSFKLYNRTKCFPIQQEIIGVFDKIFNKTNSIEIIPFTLT